MSTTTWILLQLWVAGFVGGLLWLLMSWTKETWERFARQKHHPSNPDAALRAIKAGFRYDDPRNPGLGSSPGGVASGRSITESSSAPTSTTIADIQSQIMKPTTAPSEP